MKAIIERRLEIGPTNIMIIMNPISNKLGRKFRLLVVLLDKASTKKSRPERVTSIKRIKLPMTKERKEKTN